MELEAWTLLVQLPAIECPQDSNRTQSHIIFKVPRKPSKISQHTKNQEKADLYEKSQQTGRKVMMTQILDLFVKDIKFNHVLNVPRSKVKHS